MKAHWQSAAFGLAAILVAASAQAGRDNHGGNKSGGNQFRSQSNFGGNNGGLKLSQSFNSPASGIARSGGSSNNSLGLPKFNQNGNTGIVLKIGGQTFKPQILNQNGSQNGLGIKLNPAIKGPINNASGRSPVVDSIKNIGLNNGPKFDKVGIKPADLIKTKPLDPGFSKPAKPIGIGVIANGQNGGNKNGVGQNSKKNGVGLGLGIGLGVMKNLMGHHHHNHCHDFCKPSYCWPSSCVTIDCCHYISCQPPIYCLPPVTVVEVVTVIELPVVVEQTVIAPPPPEVDPTAVGPATDAVAVQPAVTEAAAVVPGTDATIATPETEAATRSLAETPVSTAAAPVEDANLVKIQVGSQVELKGKDLGADAGQVVVQVGDLMLPATMKEWKNESVKAELPRIGVVNPTKAFLHVVKPDGKFASSLPCLLIAPPQPAK